MRPVPAGGCGLCLVVAGLMMTPGGASAQGAEVRLLGVDMYGGTVVPDGSDPGVSFGARLGLLTFFASRVRMGPALDWWTARRRRSSVDTRDVVAHLDAWTEMRTARWIRAHAGLGFGLHSVDAAVEDGGIGSGEDEALADSLEGRRLGAAGFAGASFRLTGTGALWLIAEYRYTLASRISNHQLRAGVRLSVSDF